MPTEHSICDRSPTGTARRQWRTTAPMSANPRNDRSMADPSIAPWVLSALFNHRVIAAGKTGGAVFVFPGHGAQWAEMAVELMGSAQAFSDEMNACEAAFSEFLDWSILESLRDRGASKSSGVAQAVSFAVMVSLAAQWRALGIHPDAVLGHSHGEIAAAYVAGGLSLRDAAMVVAQRTTATATIAGLGGMASVELPVDRVQALIEPWGQAISVAAQNGPSSTVVTGDATALDEFVVEFDRDDVAVARIPVDYAPHSEHVDELRDTLRDSLSGVQPRSSDIAYISALTGAQLGTAILDGDYWYANLRQPVLFEQAVRWAYQHDYPTFVECCPTPVLITAIQQVLDDHDASESDGRSALRQ